MSTRDLGIVKFTGYTSATWRTTRPKQSWKPFGGDNGAKGTDPSYYAKMRDGSQIQIYNDMNSSDIEDNNPHGIWTSNNSEDAYSHRVYHKNAHSSFMQLGWDSNSNVDAIENAGNIAPIRNFSGMAFKWNRRGSYWSDSAINIDGVYFTIYDRESSVGYVYQQPAELGAYKGLNPMENGDANASDNNCYFQLSNEDWSWVSGKNRFLIGITIQFYQKAEGGSSHSRVFKIYDLQPIFGHTAVVNNAHQMQMNYTNLGGIKQAVMAEGGKQRPFI